MTQIEITETGTERYTFDFESDDAPETPDVFVTETFTDSYGTERAVLDGDTYNAKDVIKFDWETTHHKFDGDRKEWIVDADALDTLAEKLEDSGFTFGEARGEMDGPLFDLHTQAEMNDHLEIEYEKKNGTGTGTYAGTVLSTSENPVQDGMPQVTLVREDDNHMMYVRHDSGGRVSLYTSGSAYPYVGRVTTVELTKDSDN